MVFWHRRHVDVNLLKKRTGQVTNTSLHKGWVRDLCSLTFTLNILVGENLVFWVGCGEGRGESQGSTSCMKHCLLKCNMVVEILEGDSNIPGPSPTLYEACFKI